MIERATSVALSICICYNKKEGIMEKVKKYLKNVLTWGRNGIVGVLALVGLAVVVMVGIALGEDYYQRHIKSPYDEWSNIHDVSSDVLFIESGNQAGYIYNKERDEKTIRRVRWIVKSTDNDSMAVYATADKRGYFNPKTGEPVLPAEYDRAWVFSEGIAAVVKNGCLQFIGTDGEKMFERVFKWNQGADDYVFHDGFCSVRDCESQLVGMIDREGRNVLPFEYQRMQYADHHLWIVRKENRVGLLDSVLNVMFPCEYKRIVVTPHDGVLVTNNENICQLYDYDGKGVLRDLVIANVMRLEYEEYVNDDVFTLVTRQATCFCYTCDTYMPIHYGLMSPDGKLLTKPIFSSIQAITRDLYLCQPGGVLLNSRGEEI